MEWPHAGGIGPVNENGTDSDPDLVSPSNHGSAFFSAAMCPCGQQAAHISHGPSGTSPVSVRTPRARYPWPPSALRSSWRGHCRLHKVRRLNDLPLQLRDLLVAISQHRTVLRIGLGNNIGNLTGCLEPTPSICCFSCCSSCSLTCASSLWSPCCSSPVSRAPWISPSMTGPVPSIRRSKQKKPAPKTFLVQGTGVSQARSGDASGGFRLQERFRTRQPSLQTRRYRIYRVSYRFHALSNRWRSACCHSRTSSCLLPF